VVPDQGLSTDLGLFRSWATTLASVGPGAFYGTAGSANYPPGYLYVLWLIGALAGPVGTLLGTGTQEATLLLLKLPAMLADVAIAALLYRAARRWMGERQGLVAAALYLAIPVTWYDSALWGQVDAVAAVVMLAAILLLIDGWSEAAAVAAVLAVLVKPQAGIVLVVVVPVLVGRHLLRPGTDPRPRVGPRLAALDRHFGILGTPGPVRLATTAAAAAAALVVPLIPFDIARFGPAALADVPVVGHVAGLVGLFAWVGSQYAVLTANAYNVWALVGSNPLAAAIGSSTGAWTPDSLVVAGGLPASTVGTALLVATGILVAGTLLVRDGRLPILLGFTIVAFAFYLLPTRVHERYLFPFFVTGALLAAGSIARVLGYAAVGLANAVNLHAVLAAPLSIGASGAGGGPGGPGGFAGRVGAGGPGGLDGLGGVGGRGGSEIGSISLPLADLARSEAVVTAIAVGQAAAFAVLLVAWVAVVLRPRLPRRVAHRPGLAHGAAARPTGARRAAP